MKTNISSSRIKYKLTIKVPGTKLLADYLFHSKVDLESFLNLNDIKPFLVQSVILKDPALDLSK